MVDELEDFSINTDTSLTVEDFIDDSEVTTGNTPKSNNNMAAHMAALSGDDDKVLAFRQSLSDLENGTDGVDSSEAILAAKADNNAKDQAALVDLLGDNTIDTEAKPALVDALNIGRETGSTTQELVGHKAIVDESKAETAEASTQREDVALAMKEVFAFHRAKQQILNRSLAKRNPSVLNTVKDVVELMIPFVDQADTAELSKSLKDFTGSEDLSGVLSSVLLGGTSNKKMSEIFSRMDIPSRMRLVQGVADIVDQHDGIVLGDDNDFARMIRLRTILEDGFFTDADQTIGDVVSILDATIVGGPLARLLKGGSKVFKGSKPFKPFKPPTDDLIEGPTTVVDPSRVPKDLKGANIPESTSVVVRPSTEVTVPTEDVVSSITIEGVRSDVSPTSLANTLAETNPGKARDLHKLAATDEEVAQAAYGTSSVEAVASDLLPLAGGGGPLPPRVHKLDTDFSDDLGPLAGTPEFKIEDDGFIFLFNHEKDYTRKKITGQLHNIRDALNLSSRVEMFQIKHADDGLSVQALYGPKDGGFVDPVEALEMAEFTFRERGVRFEDITLVQRTPQGYVNVPKNTTEPGEYLTAVNYKYRFQSSDMSIINPANVKRNFADFIPTFGEGKHGTLSASILTNHSMLHPTLTLGANRGVDVGFAIEARLKDVAKTFSKGFTKLGKGRRDLLAKAIYKANDEGKEITLAGMKAQGFTDKEVDIINSWKTANDNVYDLSNLDYSRSLRNAGFMRFTDTGSESVLWAKPILEGKFPDSIKTIDPSTGELKQLNKDQIAEVFANGGKIARLKDKIIRGDDAIEFVVSKETPDNFLRAINDGDRVLNYRAGYFQVRHESPRFIIKEYKDSKGNVIDTSTIGEAKSIKDADLMVSRFTKTNNDPSISFKHRGDLKDVDGFNDNYGLSKSQGLSSQRFRGEGLEDASSNALDPSTANIKDPLEALTDSIRNISRRVSMRDYLDNTKQRALIQYADVLKRDPVTGDALYPEKLSDIGLPGEKIARVGKRQVADARTTFEYIRYLENGWVDAIDDGIKAIFTTMADNLGAAGFGTLESLSRSASGLSPNTVMRTSSFNLMLALNPLRQGIIQSHQGLLLMSQNPKFMVNPQGMAAHMAVVGQGLIDGNVSKLVAKAAGLTVTEANLVAKQFTDSGLGSSFDSNNVVQNARFKLAESSFLGKIFKPLTTLTGLSKNIGFDAGELANVASAWLSFRDEAIKANKGKPLGQAQLDRVGAIARSFTFNMNRAGDVPYNQNFLRGMMQFQQVPHKAFMNATFNRSLPASVRKKNALLYTVAFGVPGGAILSRMFGIEDENVRQTIEDGVVDLTYNAVLSQITGEDVDIDFSTSLAPGNIHQMATTVLELMTTPAADLIAKSPGGQLFFGSDARITDAVKNAFRFMGLIGIEGDDTDDLESLLKSFASVTSGASNAFKAQLALELGYVQDKLGRQGPFVNTTESVAMAFGFSTKDARKMREAKTMLWLQSSKAREEAKVIVRDRIKLLTRTGASLPELKAGLRVNSVGWLAFNKAPFEMKTLMLQEVRKLTGNQRQNFFNNLQKAMGLIAPKDFEAIVDTAPIPEEQKKTLRGFKDHIEELGKEKL